MIVPITFQRSNRGPFKLPDGQDFPNFDPDSQGSTPTAELSPAELAAEFARLRAALCAAVSPTP
ncbi:MAG: hypothetical protein V9H69_16775 [Anaerolineae bacterium]